MTNTDFIKIRASLVLNPNIDVTSRGIDGRPTFSQEFMEKLYDYEEEFRRLLILPINEAVGLHNWAIRFVQHPTPMPTFFADIYTDSKENYLRIANIIGNIIQDVNFSYYHKGTLSEYISH